MLSPVTFDYSIRLSYEAQAGTAFVFALLPARTHHQQLVTERLRVRGAVAQTVFTDAATATRYLHVAASGGALALEVDATVRLLQTEHTERGLRREARAAPLGSPESLRYLLPSRYCPAERLGALAGREFLEFDAPFDRLDAIRRWLRRHVHAGPAVGPVPGTDAAAAATGASATDVLAAGRGSPRDLAHLAIALCRASRLPARFVTTVPLGAGPAVELHPWVEALVEDTWLAFDPVGRVPRTALLRLGTGRDAADVPLAIAHGSVTAGRLETTLVCHEADAARLAASDERIEAIAAATLGSLGEATRWHQEARLAARRPQVGGGGESRRPAPSQAAAAAARTAASIPRRTAQVLVFPAPPPSRGPGELPGPRLEPA